VFGNVELSAPNKLEEERALVAEEKLRKSLVINELEKTPLLEISWRQKSRVLWLKESDKCIVFPSGRQLK
jgi:hypothetical protein